MAIDGNMVLWLRVEAGRHQPFDVTGHYPILAGYDEADGAALYVAAHKYDSVYHFTHVKNGARTVRYTDEIGEVHAVGKFFVLALRCDPMDLPLPHPRIPESAMDQTGPLYWLKFWPQKDPDYCARSDSGTSDDSHLESLLNSYSTREKGGMEGDLNNKINAALLLGVDCYFP